MPRLTNRNPSYRRHKASGQAIVKLNGQDVYLGQWGSATSKREYDRVVGEYLARGRQLTPAGGTTRVADVVAAYWQFAAVYYGTPGRRPRLYSVKRALALLRRLYGETLALDFGPLAFQNVRAQMIREGWSRPYVNEQMGRLRRCFKWAAARELIPASVVHGLETIEGLRHGESDARETDPVKPVPAEWVEATIPHVSDQVAGMIRLQLASGMRPGEVVIMRGCDLDTTGDVWRYTPERHKTQHHGHARSIFLGPQAQEIIRPFLKTDLAAYLFSPADAERERREVLHAARKTPLNCGNVPGSNRKREPLRDPADHYTVNTYRGAIRRACDVAFAPPAELIRQKMKGKKVPRHRWRRHAQRRRVRLSYRRDSLSFEDFPPTPCVGSQLNSRSPLSTPRTEVKCRSCRTHRHPPGDRGAGFNAPAVPGWERSGPRPHGKSLNMTDSPSPAMRALARRLLVLEATSPAGTAADTPAQHEAVRVCEKLRISLTRFAGADGFAALLRRTLALARAEVPSLGRISVKPDCSMEGLEALAKDDPEAGVEAAAALTAHLLELLVTFIGESLTLRLVREAWPDESLDE